MTLGDIRLRVAKRVPTVDAELIAGFVMDRYYAILDSLSWRRQQVAYAMETVAPYMTGTITVTNGSDQVQVDGGSFSDAMEGMAFRVEGSPEYYEFDPNDDLVTGTLDRPFDGDSGTGLSYTLTQAIYQIPSDARIVDSVHLLSRSVPLLKQTKAQLDASAPQRGMRGVPRLWVPSADANTDPPVMQIEMYPAPDQVYSFAVSYTMEAPALSGSATTLLPWLRPSALVAGATADALEVAKDWAGADRTEAKYLSYLADMRRADSAQRGPQRLKPSDWMARTELQRVVNSLPRTGPRW